MMIRPMSPIPDCLLVQSVMSLSHEHQGLFRHLLSSPEASLFTSYFSFYLLVYAPKNYI